MRCVGCVFEGCGCCSINLLHLLLLAAKIKNYESRAAAVVLGCKDHPGPGLAQELNLSS